MRNPILGMVLLLALGATTSAIAQYPDPPAVGVNAIFGHGGPPAYVSFTLLPGDVASIKVAFTGNATGCALELHAFKGGSPLAIAKHDLSKSPDTVTFGTTNNSGQPVTYYISAWTFHGGPPLESGIRSDGWQHGQAFVPMAGGPVVGFNTTVASGSVTHFQCRGSAHGPTEAYARLTIQ